MRRLARGPATRQWVAASTLLLFACLLVWQQINGVFAFDQPLLKAVHSLSSPVIVEASRWLAWLGYGYGVLPIDGLIVLGLMAARRWRDAGFAFLALWGGLVLNTLLKHAISRPRPGLDTVRELQSSYAFPSGHAMATAVLAATAIALTWHTRWRWPVLVITGLFALLVGLGRVHAGVHYPSDVAAGWLAGIAWVCLIHIAVLGKREARPAPKV